jgi:hypothetical protein
MINNIKNINTNTDKLVVAFYPRQAGGKFLLNCLGLSDLFVLQHAEFAKKQINKQFTIHEKYTELMFRLNKVNHKWNDLNLGCIELFGDVSFLEYIPKEFNLQHLQFNHVIRDLSFNNYYFPVIAHSIFKLECVLNKWPNAKIIQFVNYDNFINLHRPSFISSKWQELKGPSWPDTAPGNLDQYYQLDTAILNELKMFDVEDIFTRKLIWQKDAENIENYKNHLLKNIFDKNICYVWDVDCYLDQSLFLSNLENLYNVLGLGTLNHNYILNYRKLYLKKLADIATFNKTRSCS